MTENNCLDKIFLCDSCGTVLKQGKLRYILDLKLYAAPDMELEEADFYKDLLEEMGKIAEMTSSMNEQEMMDEVNLVIKLDLCKKCRDSFVKEFRKMNRRIN